MSTIKPAVFPNISRHAVNRPNEHADILRSGNAREVEPGKSAVRHDASGSIEDRRGAEPLNQTRTAEGKTIKFYRPNKVKIQKPVVLGTYIDIKV
ncbi:MAG: hypothetical protein ACE5HO_00720 [bacterium]